MQSFEGIQGPLQTTAENVSAVEGAHGHKTYDTICAMQRSRNILSHMHDIYIYIIFECIFSVCISKVQ